MGMGDNTQKIFLADDETRVKLVDVEEEVGADYINANYINGEVKSAEKAYIASQGCMPATVPAFWQMIWENNGSINQPLLLSMSSFNVSFFSVFLFIRIQVIDFDHLFNK